MLAELRAGRRVPEPDAVYLAMVCFIKSCRRCSVLTLTELTLLRHLAWTRVSCRVGMASPHACAAQWLYQLQAKGDNTLLMCCRTRRMRTAGSAAGSPDVWTSVMVCEIITYYRISSAVGLRFRRSYSNRHQSLNGCQNRRGRLWVLVRVQGRSCA